METTSGKLAFTAVYRQDDGWWIGWVQELNGANVQERTLEEARQSMREVIALLLGVDGPDCLEPGTEYRDKIPVSPG